MILQIRILIRESKHNSHFFLILYIHLIPIWRNKLNTAWRIWYIRIKYRHRFTVSMVTIRTRIPRSCFTFTAIASLTRRTPLFHQLHLKKTLFFTIIFAPLVWQFVHAFITSFLILFNSSCFHSDICILGPSTGTISLINSTQNPYYLFLFNLYLGYILSQQQIQSKQVELTHL